MREDWKRQAARVLGIIAGTFTILLSVALAIYVTASSPLNPPSAAIVVAIAALLAPGVLAIVGGACASRCRHWALALARAICAIVPPLITPGILSTVWMTLSRNEFGAQRDSA
jgi:4-amino-4-deoxy-L-arabinose transferase-like glycosyltransferase